MWRCVAGRSVPGASKKGSVSFRRSNVPRKKRYLLLLLLVYYYYYYYYYCQYRQYHHDHHWPRTMLIWCSILPLIFTVSRILFCLYYRVFAMPFSYTSRLLIVFILVLSVALHKLIESLHYVRQSCVHSPAAVYVRVFASADTSACVYSWDLVPIILSPFKPIFVELSTDFMPLFNLSFI
jgi:hypothetical protein